jgi:hypothetical protein
VRDILKPMNLTDSTSPSIRRAADEPKNWRAQGEKNPKKDIRSTLSAQRRISEGKPDIELGHPVR